MLRIVLEAADLARVSFLAVPHLDLAASVQALHHRGAAGFVETWRRTALPKIPPQARPLLELVPANGLIPQSLTGFHAVSRSTATPELVAACRAYDRSCLSPARATTTVLVWRELARLTALRQWHGPAAVLGGLTPGIRWRGEVLEMDHWRDEEIRPAGRGLMVIPGVFWRGPGLRVADLPCPALVYPIATGVPDIDPLARLLGPTRAKVLLAIVTGPSTSGLARLTGISAASASEHAAVLRDSGLVATGRRGRAVRHRLTPLGLALLAPHTARSGGHSGPRLHGSPTSLGK